LRRRQAYQEDRRFVTSEGELVRRAQSGDQQAFATLVLEHQQFVYNLALRTLGHEDEAEDIAQETFVRAWQALPRFQGKARFRTWLYRIVTNLCCNRLPSLRRELARVGAEEAQDVPDETFVDPADSVESNELYAFLYQQIAALPESYRLLVTLRYQHELSYEEVAHVVGVPLSKVKNGLFRARSQLRKVIQAYEEEQR
jgi:RNA polymerase sigma-70 factor (ECF subfamily)